MGGGGRGAAEIRAERLTTLRAESLELLQGARREMGVAGGADCLPKTSEEVPIKVLSALGGSHPARLQGLHFLSTNRAAQLRSLSALGSGFTWRLGRVFFFCRGRR